ncbi:MAG TPA: HDIG domain-containing protein [Bacteroidales bacterium]|nr:HDIG domain-containing protein [Bacteroidales bacterium]HPS46307.1 HDIG domain-containing protein [Bacteroidales bacterium]HQH18808.1 HDIG domain-containing protein [Bacteroidales bacterium]HQI44938.1 HDIG domain-containing protein [Bacteroidales bacterium]
MISREEAFLLVKEYIKNERTIWHCLASEAVMWALANHLKEDTEKWAMAGLLHDLDVEITHADPKIHGLETARILTEKGIDPEIIEAIQYHNEDAEGVAPRHKKLHHALAAGETITGLIQATTYVYPDKKIASVKPSSVVKRMKEKAFAASVKRENIKECEIIGIPLNEFAEIAVQAMQKIANQIGL